MTPEEASLRGRLGQAAQRARHDPKEYTVAARAAAFERFVDEVDPGRTLAPQERVERAKAAQRAHMLRIALASARSRKAKR